ncbi:hypothetical protein Dimus_017433 [Dionaea muscipula]
MALVERRLVKSRRRFEYLHDIQKYPPGMVDVHHVLIPRRSGLKTTGLWVFLLALCSSSLYMLLSEDSSITILLYGIVVGVILLKLLQGTTVAKGMELCLWICFYDATSNLTKPKELCKCLSLRGCRNSGACRVP